MTPRPGPPYEWDEDKREDTLRIREVDFLLVEQADWLAAIHHRSDRDGELRYSSHVPIGDRLYNVVWTPRGSYTLNQQCQKVGLPPANNDCLADAVGELELDGVLEDLSQLVSYRQLVMFVFRRLRRKWETALAP